MPENTSLTPTAEFQPLLLRVAPDNKKDFGYGNWNVACPRCGTIRTVRSHKYKSTGDVRAAQHMCHPCRAIVMQRRVSIKCPSCGKTRMLRLGDAKERLSSFCQRCVKQTFPTRDKSGPHTSQTSRGYVVVLGMTGHPLAKRNSVHQHWLTLYEQHPMGAESVLWFRDQGFTVHHKNGVRSDNRLENLELRAPGKHPHGWTIEDMEEVIRRYRNDSQSGG